MLHPTPDRLEGYVDGSLDDAERAVLESHLLGCLRCQAEVEELTALFAVLATLPTIEPSADFADRVMAGVRIRRPWLERVAALVGRLLPSTTTGWALATAMLALPVLTAGTLTAWLVSKPWFTAQTMAVFLIDQVVGVFYGFLVTAIGFAFESRLGGWILQGGAALLGQIPGTRLGAAFALGAIGTVGSCWVLYKYLFRTPTREEYHATQSI